MKPFAKLACSLLAAAIASPALAQDNEAEKLFQAMEKKIQTAKAFRVVVTVKTQGDTKDRVGNFKGSLLLTKDNQARLKISGVDFGEARTWEMISDGKQVRLKPYSAMPVFKDEATLPTPKNFHGYLGTVVSRSGVFASVFGMPYLIAEADHLGQADPGGTKLDTWDFKAGAAEKVDGRDAKVISFRVGKKGANDAPAVTVWVDSQTLLPLKRVLVTKAAGTITEVCNEFTLDPKIGPKDFVLPRAVVPPEENVPIEKVPPAVTQAAKKRFPQTELRSAVFARPGSAWLRPDDNRAAYFLDLKNGKLHIAVWITPEGDIIAYVNEIKSADLPKEVKQYLAQNYPKETLQEVNELIKVVEGKELLEHYKLFLTTAENRTRVLVFSAEGKFLKEEK